MRHKEASFCFILLLFSKQSLGQNPGTILARHREQIQRYIMAGHGEGWSNCDLISADPPETKSGFHCLSTQFVIDFVMLRKLDINSMLSYSHCLLAAYHIKSKEGLSDILQFGERVFRHKRIALILTLEIGVTLRMANEISKIPFLVAAELKRGGEEFLCPIVGRQEPILQDSMCEEKYASYQNKKLRVGIFGVIPHVFIKGNKYTNSVNVGIDGTDYRLIKLLAEKLKFVPDVKIPWTFEQGSNMVVRNQSNSILVLH